MVHHRRSSSIVDDRPRIVDLRPSSTILVDRRRSWKIVGDRARSLTIDHDCWLQELSIYLRFWVGIGIIFGELGGGLGDMFGGFRAILGDC